MANKRITELISEATTVKSDHYIPVDHGTDGTQKMSMSTLIDDTLSVSGAAADAKATGDAINGLKSDLNQNFGNVVPLTSGYIQTNQATGASVPIASPQPSTTLSYGIVDCEEGDIFVLYGSGESYGRLWAFVDSSNNMVAKSGSNLSADGLTVRAPADSAKFIVNTTGACYVGNTVGGKLNALDLAKVMSGYSYIKDSYIKWDGSIASNAGRYCTGYIPCSENMPVTYVGESAHTSVCGIAFYDIEKKFISGYVNNAPNGTEITVTSPQKTAYCRTSTNTATFLKSYVRVPNGSLSDTIDKTANVPSIVRYIAPDGNDTTGDGTLSSPFATANKALSSGATKIMVKQGKYFQRINLSNAVEHSITIVSNDPTGKAVFIAPDALVSDSELSVSGYDNIYSCSFSGTLSPGMRLYQDGVPDASTTISDAERNPYQRGQECRCLDTKIIPCTATSLNDALTEIQNSDVYKYFYDSNSGVIYFSRPQEVTDSYPIMRAVNTTMFYNSDRSIELSMYGIECKYMACNVQNMIVHLEDCKVAYSYGSGGFIYGSSLIDFVRCEACGAHGNATGDGFNAHSSSTGDPFSKQTTARLVDCWSHDCMDDGYSDHERSETEVWGGLFEYNGKAGITPAYGTHCSCYNVLSRNNYSGFLYLGEVTPEEGGKYGQMLCIGCVAENNTEATSGYGFAVKSSGNLAKLINCKSIGNLIGYYSGPLTILELIDCGSADDTTVKRIDGTLIVKNTETVTI